MIPTQTLIDYPVFGNSATIVKPGDEKYAGGFLPSDLLPAQWHNYFLNKSSSAITCLNAGVSSMEAELNCLVTASGGTPAAGTGNQVYNAVLYQINAALSNSAPSGFGSAASAGISTKAARADHVHKYADRITDGAAAAKAECSNELNIYPSVGNSAWINYRGGAASVSIGNGAGNGTLGNLNANLITATLCGNVCGTAACASFLKSTSNGGIYSDAWGNIRHNNNCTTNTWNVYSFNCTPMLSVGLENGVVTAGTCFVGNLTGNVTGKAACAAYAETLQFRSGTARYITAFNWQAGSDAQPTWLLGGNDASNLYLYNPSNFTVTCATNAHCAAYAGDSINSYNLKSLCDGGVITDNYGNFKHNNNNQTNTWNIYNYAGVTMFSVGLENGVVTAGTCFVGNLTGNVTGNVTGKAACAAYAETLQTRNGSERYITTFNWQSTSESQPTWLWGGNDSSSMYVYNPANFSVARATNASYLISPNEGGVNSVEFGNFKHNNNNQQNTWNIYNYAGAAMFSVGLETGIVTAGTCFVGNLTGTATSANNANNADYMNQKSLTNLGGGYWRNDTGKYGMWSTNSAGVALVAPGLTIFNPDEPQGFVLSGIYKS